MGKLETGRLQAIEAIAGTTLPKGIGPSHSQLIFEGLELMTIVMIEQRNGWRENYSTLAMSLKSDNMQKIIMMEQSATT